MKREVGWHQSPVSGYWFLFTNGVWSASYPTVPPQSPYPVFPVKSVALPHLNERLLPMNDDIDLDDDYSDDEWYGDPWDDGDLEEDEEPYTSECGDGTCFWCNSAPNESPASGEAAGKSPAAVAQDSATPVQKGSYMASSLPTGRQHRTALVIDTRNGVSADFKNRYARLLQSVGGSNIKVDVLTLRGNAAQTGPALVKGTPDQFVAPEADEADIDLVGWAADQGYTQLLVAVDVQSAVKAAA